MKRFHLPVAAFAVLCAVAPAQAQTTNVHLKEVHIFQSVLEPTQESILIRGLTPGNKKIQLRLNNVAKLPSGTETKSDCIRFATTAVLDETQTLEVFLEGPAVTVGAVDGRGYKGAIFTLTAGQTVSCLLVSKNKFNHAGTGIVWYELP